MMLRNVVRKAILAHKLADKNQFVQKSINLPDHGPAISSSSIQVATKVVDRPPQDAPPQDAGAFPTPDFRDTATIYRNKNWIQLLRAFIVFSLCSSDFLVNNQLKILSWSRRLLGLRIFRFMMRGTIYGQFMAGEKEKEVLAVAENNAKSGLYPMFSYTAAEVHGDAKEADGIASQDNIHIKNYNAIQEGLRMASAAKEFAYMAPQLATKLTFFTASDVLYNFSTLVAQQEAVLKHLMQNGDAQMTEQLVEYLVTVLNKSMTTYGGTGMVVPGIESDLHLPALVTNLPFNLELSRSKEIRTFIQDSSLPISPMSGTDENSLLDLWQKLVTLGQLASDEGVVLILDAEQTYLTPAIECLTIDLMRKYNSQRPTIHNTYQCYLKRTLDIVLRDLELSKREGFCLGLKVVRGAYIQEERTRAANLGYEDPVNPTYDATTEMYERVASHLLQTIKELEPGRVHTTFATHNEDTVKYVLNRIEEVGVNLEGRNLGFAQLLGMRDHISYALGQTGIPAAKLISYGVVEEGIMWLSRRVTEMHGAGQIMVAERRMLQTELKRRLKRSR